MFEKIESFPCEEGNTTFCDLTVLGNASYDIIVTDSKTVNRKRKEQL